MMEQSTGFADLQIISESIIQAIRKPTGISSKQSLPPDEMMSSLAGPIVASHGDWYVFVDNGFETEVVAIWRDEQVDRDRRLFVYGDPAYCGSRVVMGAYKKPPGAQLTQNRLCLTGKYQLAGSLWNTALLTFRISG